MAQQTQGAGNELERIRQCISTVLNAAITVTEKFPPCHGGIFRSNVSRVFEEGNDQDLAMLGERTSVLALWMNWIKEGSADVAYIPPEGINALPASATDCKKVDSWALGCLTIQLINCDLPLRLRRQFRFGTYDYCPNGATLQQLKDFYKGAGQAGLAVGPEMSLLKPVPCACEEFLAHCLEPDPTKRWSLHELSKLPFLDSKYTLAGLFALDATVYQQLLPTEGRFTVTNIQPHPFMPPEPAMTVQVGDIHWTDDVEHQQKNIEIWRFPVFGRDANEVETARRLMIKAFGKAMDVLTMESHPDERTKKRADYYGIRALQRGARNVVHHFGCQFFLHPAFPMEFQVFTEHCPGGNLRDAVRHYLPVDLIGRWILEILEGLMYLHGHGIVHRNLNSSIVFFTEKPFKGDIKIGGFHLMRQLEGAVSVKNEISARPGPDGRFVAPEMLDMQKEYDLHTGRKCDTWSLGCIALHLASGQPPVYRDFKGKPIELEMAVLNHLNKVKSLPEIPDWIPYNIHRFVIQCLQFNPAERPYAVELDTSELLTTNISELDYQASRGGIPLPEGVAEYWRH